MSTGLGSREATDNAGGCSFCGVKGVAIGCRTVERTREMRKTKINAGY